jgi:V8-like Glu-specific endopeptidase
VVRFHQFPLQKVPSSNAPPFRWTGLIYTTFPDVPDKFRSTGVLLDSRVILTAAHNFYDDRYGGAATSATFELAANRTKASPPALPTFPVVTIDRWEYKNKPSGPDRFYDVAVAHLDKDVSLNSYPELREVTAGDFAKWPSVLLAGYPDPDPNNEEMEYAEGQVDTSYFGLGLLRYKIDADEGTSGGGLIPRVTGVHEPYRIVGVHRGSDAPKEWNQGIPITKTILEEIERLRKKIVSVQSGPLASESVGDLPARGYGC